VDLKKEIFQVLKNAQNQGVLSRASITVVNARGEVVSVSIGDLSGEPISNTTLFDVASVTKAIPVSILGLLALESHKVSLETPLVELIDSLDLKCASTPRFKHLLTQTLDFGFSLASLKSEPAEKVLTAILNAPLNVEPGEKFYYCNATSILLGLALESVFGAPLDLLAQEYVFRPLDMSSTCFRPKVELRSKIVPTEMCNWRGRAIQGEIHDESAWTLNSLFVPGAAGLFSTTRDLGMCVSMLVNDGAPLFRSGFIASCAQNHIPYATGGETGLGFEFNQQYMGDNRSSKTIGKTGFTGSVIVADLARNFGFTLLSDYTWPHRKSSKESIMELRKVCSDIVWKYADSLV